MVRMIYFTFSCVKLTAVVDPTVPRVSDSAFLRESVDFSDLLESSIEREDNRRKK